MKEGIRVYNLYPKLLGHMSNWKKYIKEAKDMEFDWIYINPINAPGFSGSDYAVKDHYKYHPMFVTGWPVDSGEYSDTKLKENKIKGDELLKDICNYAKSLDIKIMMDLVINHTAIDNPLTREKPQWFLRDEDGKIKNPGADNNGKWVVWGDLAQIDNENSVDRDNLWLYWLLMMQKYCSLGIRGFRCDAAYHVPKELWEYLIKNIKTEYKEVVFLGETLGCTPKELQVVAESGFDFVMNSFKWWNYKDEWFLKDYIEWAGLYPSLTFPENHDTARFAKENFGSSEKAINTYQLQAYFCSSIAITIGFEYGFEKKIDVVKTNPDDFEEKRYDIRDKIKYVNQLKKKYSILHQDNIIAIYNFDNNNIFAFLKESLDKTEKIFVIANLSEENWEKVYIKDFYSLLENEEILDLSLYHKMNLIPREFEYHLKPLEVKLFYARK